VGLLVGAGVGERVGSLGNLFSGMVGILIVSTSSDPDAPPPMIPKTSISATVVNPFGGLR
jgi:hypothetical protein